MTKAVKNRLRKACLALPEATEKEAWGHPTYRVRDRMFAMEADGDGRVSVWAKSDPESRETLIELDPDRFFVPPYMGPKGWIGIRLDNDPDWHQVEGLLARAYLSIAPKKLAALLEIEKERS